MSVFEVAQKKAAKDRLVKKEVDSEGQAVEVTSLLVKTFGYLSHQI